MTAVEQVAMRPIVRVGGSVAVVGLAAGMATLAPRWFLVIEVGFVVATIAHLRTASIALGDGRLVKRSLVTGVVADVPVGRISDVRVERAPTVLLDRVAVEVDVVRVCIGNGIALEAELWAWTGLLDLLDDLR